MKLCLINNTYKAIVKNGVYSGVLFSYTLTINPTPADATVTFSTGTVSGNSCTVADGTSVTYTVSKTGYAPETATVTITADQTINVTLSEGHYTPDQVLYESSTGGASTTLNLLDDGKYQVICIAGGGGGAGTAYSTAHRAGGGGSGSGFNCIFQLSAGSYAVAVGKGGAKATFSTMAGGTAGTGGDSRFGTCYSRGGKGGQASNNPTGGAGGAAPTLTYTRTTTTLNKAGNAGGNVSSTKTASGGAAVYSSYGKGGNGHYSNSVNGTAGYVKVVYKGA